MPLPTAPRCGRGSSAIIPSTWPLRRSLVEKFGLKPVTLRTGGVMSPEFIRRQVDVCLEERIAVFAAGLGDPGWVVPLAHQAGMKVMGLVGNVRNAKRQVQSGVDYVIAQGYEAGGHTGTIANFPLIPMVVDAVSAGAGHRGRRHRRRPHAAGGPRARRGRRLGRHRFPAGRGIPDSIPGHQDEIIRGAAEDFVITRAYTGKTARDYRNDVIKAWDESGLRALPMPLQGVLMDDLIAVGRGGRAPRTDQQSGGPDRRHADAQAPAARHLAFDGGRGRGRHRRLAAMRS